MIIKLLSAIASLCAASRLVSAHDTWVEANAMFVPAGQYTYVNLMLGNHGNEHRDFKLASKITIEPCTLVAISPSGKITDLTQLPQQLF